MLSVFSLVLNIPIACCYSSVDFKTLQKCQRSVKTPSPSEDFPVTIKSLAEPGLARDCLRTPGGALGAGLPATMPFPFAVKIWNISKHVLLPNKIQHRFSPHFL